MGHRNEDSIQENDLGTKKMETRRTRGLSQRLRKPLSIESNVPPPERPTVSEDMHTRTVSPPPAATTKAVALQPSAAGGPKGAGVQPVEAAAGTQRVTPLARDVEAQKKPAEGLLKEGVQLQNRYKILGVVGLGGMGAVYKAQDLRFPGVMRVCAVKEMFNTAADPQVRQVIIRTFEREASILATLSHPAIPQVYDFFTEGARSYLVMEFVSGKNLEELLVEGEGFISESLVIDWTVQLCDVLSYLHNHKPRPIIFRDLKPANVMLDDHSRIRLIDFGIAKLFQSGEKGTMIGTEGYSPPEQYRGIAEPRGDIYALGATLHHMLSKKDPRMEPPFSFHERPIHQTNPTVSRELVEVINKSLEYDINKRWGSAEEFKRVMLSLPGGKGVGGSVHGETAAFGTGNVKPLWRFACEDEIRGAVTVYEDMVFVPSYDHNLYALNAETGKFIWKYPAEDGIASKPLVINDMVIFGSSDKVVYALDIKTGRLMWTAPTKGRIFSSPYGEFGHVFIGSDDKNLYAIHAPSGRIAWTYAADGEIRTQPLITENTIFFTCQMGGVYALGMGREMRWRYRARRGILASPVVEDGFLFVGSLDWNFYALDIRSGWAAWKYRTGGAVVSTAAVWEGIIFFGSVDGYVYALDAESSRVIWRYQTENQVTGSPTVYNDGMYIGSVDGALYYFDARTGTVRWRYQTDGPITGAPDIVDGIIYFGSADHYVYAIPA
ncbi:MAG: serine/threonine-protein kinase [Anaerolineae bacterium]|nr:serine/threonine-protein kinase [Anaerolineae bacterium]